MHYLSSFCLSLIIKYRVVLPLLNCCCKFSEICATRWPLWHSDYTKFNFSRGSTAGPAGGAYDTPPDPRVGWEGIPPPIHHPVDTSSIAFGVKARCLQRPETDTGCGLPKPNFWSAAGSNLAWHSRMSHSPTGLLFSVHAADILLWRLCRWQLWDDADRQCSFHRDPTAPNRLYFHRVSSPEPWRAPRSHLWQTHQTNDAVLLWLCNT